MTSTTASVEPTPDQTYCDLGDHQHCGGYTEDESDPETCMCNCHDAEFRAEKEAEAAQQSPATASPEAQAALAATSDEELLTKHAQLTHQMHAADERASDLGVSGQQRAARDRRAAAAELRAMRDLVAAECLRRMGGNR